MIKTSSPVAADASAARSSPRLGVRSRWRLGALVLGALALFAALAVGESPLPALVLYALVLLIVLGALRLCLGAEERPFLADLFLAAFVLRVVLVVVSHVALVKLGHGGFAFADDRAYDKLGWDIARAWRGEIPGILEVDAYLLMNYTYLLGLVYFNFGHSLLAAKMLDAAFGAVTVLGAYGIGRELWGVRAGRAAGVAAALFPTLLMWSLLNLKDILVIMLLALSMFGAIRFARRGDWRAGLLAVLALAPQENMRFYIFIVLGWVMAMFFFVGSTAPLRRRLLQGLPFAVAIFATVFLLGSQTFGLEFLQPRLMKNLEENRRSDPADTRTRLAPPSSTDFDTDGVYRRQLSHLPEGVAIVLFAPPPWWAQTTRDALLQVDMLAWYIVLAGAVAGFAQGLRRRMWIVLMPAAYVGGVMLVFALTEGNVGTLVRHRAMLLPPMMGLGGLALWTTWAWGMGRLRGHVPGLRVDAQAVASAD